MNQEPVLSPKEAMEAVRALDEMIEMFEVSIPMVAKLLVPFTRLLEERDVQGWVKGALEISELDVDDAQACLIVALSVIAQVKHKTKGTPAEDQLRDIFKKAS